MRYFLEILLITYCSLESVESVVRSTNISFILLSHNVSFKSKSNREKIDEYSCRTMNRLTEKREAIGWLMNARRVTPSSYPRRSDRLPIVRHKSPQRNALYGRVRWFSTGSNFVVRRRSPPRENCKPEGEGGGRGRGRRTGRRRNSDAWHNKV